MARTFDFVAVDMNGVWHVASSMDAGNKQFSTYNWGTPDWKKLPAPMTRMDALVWADKNTGIKAAPHYTNDAHGWSVGGSTIRGFRKGASIAAPVMHASITDYLDDLKKQHATLDEMLINDVQLVIDGRKILKALGSNIDGELYKQNLAQIDGAEKRTQWCMVLQVTIAMLEKRSNDAFNPHKSAWDMAAAFVAAKTAPMGNGAAKKKAATPKKQEAVVAAADVELNKDTPADEQAA